MLPRIGKLEVYPTGTRKRVRLDFAVEKPGFTQFSQLF